MADHDPTLIDTHQKQTDEHHPPCPEGRERRGFVRIDDDLVLSCRRVDPALAPVEIPPSNQDLNAFTLKARFVAMERELRPVLHRLKERSDDLGAYLESLEQRLEMLADVLLKQEPEACALPTREVNLSAGGLSYRSPCPLEAGDLLQLRLLLGASGIGIETWARVVYCTRLDPRRAGKLPYRIGVEFLNMREADSDLIIRHVLCREAEARRERNRRLQPVNEISSDG